MNADGVFTGGKCYSALKRDSRVKDYLPEYTGGKLLQMIRFVLLKLLAFLFIVTPLWGQNVTSPPPVLLPQEVISVIDSFYSDHGLPGISLSIHGKNLGHGSYSRGFADVEDSTLIENCCSQFRVGSVVKPMTAVLMMQLVEKGLLDLDEYLPVYLPVTNTQWDSIQVRQLANHTAGIRHYRNLEFMLSNDVSSVEDGLRIFITDSLRTPPGTKHLYTSYGYNLLGHVLEKVSGTRFEELITRDLLNPSGMTQSRAEHPESEQAGRVSFYVKSRNGDLQKAPFVHNYYKLPSGGMLGSTDDLIKFGRAVLDETLISKESLELCLQPTFLPSGKQILYGLGWSISDPDKEEEFFYHSGGSVGGSTFFLIYPEEEFILALATNCSNIPLKELSFRIHEVFSRIAAEVQKP